jgi:hypothetical protein
MALLSVDECKQYLNLTDGTHDARIALLIPAVQADISEYCNNAFADTVIYRESGSALEFVRGSTLTTSTEADKITDAQDYISTSGFTAGMDIIVIGGSNQGYYTIASVSTDTITLTSTGDIEDQSQTTYHRWPGNIAVARVKWPKALKPTAAKMVWHLLDQVKSGDVKSESIDDYSVTYAGDHAYPERVIAGLRQYKRAVLI